MVSARRRDVWRGAMVSARRVGKCCIGISRVVVVRDANRNIPRDCGIGWGDQARVTHARRSMGSRVRFPVSR